MAYRTCRVRRNPTAWKRRKPLVPPMTLAERLLFALAILVVLLVAVFA
jgi:hypothetical protein